MPRQFPFQVSNSTRGKVRTALAAKLEYLQDIALRDIMAVRNRLHLTHGQTMLQPANEFGSDGDLKAISAEVTISFERIADADLSIIDESVGSIFEQLHGAQQSAMYQLVSETCDRTGNVVNAAPIGFAEAFCQMLEKIQFSVSESGTVQLPQIHTGSDPSKLIDELKGQGQAYDEMINEIIARKKDEALRAEGERKAKFRRPCE